MGAVSVIMDALTRAMPELRVSNASIEAKIIDVVGSYADSEAVERENTLKTIQKALASQKVTTVEYYRRKAVEFQLGDNLVYDPINQGGYYATVDEEKRIIKQAFIAGSFPNYTLLVNTVGRDGHLTTLTSSELGAFRTYFSAFQPIGLRIGIGSLSPAVITDPSLVVYVRDGVDAAKVANDINSAFTAAESVLRNTNIVSLTELSDLIQSIDGVVAVSFGDISAREVGIDGVERTLRPAQGLFQLTAGAYTFGTTITTSMIKTLQ